MVSVALVNQRSDRFTLRHTHYIAMDGKIEDYDRKAVVPAHGYGRRVHYSKVLGQNLGEFDFRIADGVGASERVLVVNSVNARGFGDDGGSDFQGAERRGRIGRKERV